MAAKHSCMYCGGPVGPDGYCRECRLSQDFLRKAGNTSLYYYNLGLDRAKMRDLTGALEALKLSLRYNKTNVDARNLTGLIYYETGDTLEALRNWVMSVNYRQKNNPAVRYLKALRDDPRGMERENEAARSFNLALQHARRHAFDLAVLQLKKCISLSRHLLKADLLMALILMEQGRNGAAKKFLSRVLTIDRSQPLARHLLQEMGESEDSITRLASERDEDAETLFHYYGMEQRPGERPSKKVKADRKSGRRTVRGRRPGEQSLVRLSGIYMLAGIVIGVAIFYFLVAPGIRKTARETLSDTETTYNETLSAKNGQIETLNQTVSDLESKNEKLQKSADEMEQSVTDLTREVETLKRTARDPGTDTAASPGDAAGTETSENAAAARNNAGVIGITQEEVEDVIRNE